MKNIHILPTDKPSRLFEIDGHLIINREQLIQPKYYRNIYITSDEEIEEGDWILVPSTDGKTYFDFSNSFPKKAKSNYASNNFVFKIILTTDQDLIGVQSIPDEFLEWFVKNPSCEEVKTKKEYITPLGDIVETCYDNERLNYKIIIPKEELKQERKDCHCDEPDFDVYKAICKSCGNSIIHLGKKISTADNDIPNQETLEEETLSKIKFVLLANNNAQAIRILEQYAEFQKERSYSEEVYTIQQISDLFIPIDKGGYIDDYLDYRLFSREQPKLNFKEWFEQLKKK